MATKSWFDGGKNDIFTLSEDKKKPIEPKKEEKIDYEEFKELQEELEQVEEKYDEEYVEESKPRYSQGRKTSFESYDSSDDSDSEYKSPSNFNFMGAATGVIGICVVLMVGYIVLSQVQSSFQDTGTNITDTLGAGISATAFSAFGLLAVGMIVLMGFGMVSMFKNP